MEVIFPHPLKTDGEDLDFFCGSLSIMDPVQRFFNIHAYESDCDFSTWVIDFFEDSMDSKVFHITKYPKSVPVENIGGEDDYNKQPSLPRIFYKGELLFDSTSLRACIRYMKSRNKRKWSHDDLEGFKGLMRHPASDDQVVKELICVLRNYPKYSNDNKGRKNNRRVGL